MKKMQNGGIFLSLLVWISSLAFLLANETSDFLEGKNATTCGTVYDKIKGVVRYHNGSSKGVPESISCTWTFTVVANSTPAAEVFLIVEEFLMDGADSLSIQRNGSLPLDLGPFRGSMQPFMVATGATNVNVTLKTSDSSVSRFFQMRFYMQKNFTYMMNNTVVSTLLSPFYEKNRTSPVIANIFVAVSDKEKFSLSTEILPFNVSDNFLLTLKNSSFDGNFTGPWIPLDITSDKDLFAGLHISPDNTFQQIKFVFQAVNKECSKTIRLQRSGTRSYTFTNPLHTEASAGVTPSLNCRTIVFTREENVTGLSIDVVSNNLTGLTDQLLVLNGTHRLSGALVHATAESGVAWKDRYVLTNDKKILVNLMSPFPSPSLNVSVTISLMETGGYFEGEGSLTVSQGKDNASAVYLLRVDSLHQVRLNLTNRPPKQGSLEFYRDFSKSSAPFATLSSLLEPATLLVSPGSLLMIVAKGFGSQSVNVTFGPMERGCFSYGTGDAGSYTPSGKCLPICVWRVPAKLNETSSVELRKLHFSTIILESGDSLRLVQDGKMVLNVSGPLSHLNDLLYPSSVDTSLVLQRDCSRNATVLVSQYAASPTCGHNVTLVPGRSTVVSSLGYPDNYPTGSGCKWFLSAAPPNGVLHVTFESLHLASDRHQLTLYQIYRNQSTALLANLTTANATLPRDFVLQSSNLSIFFWAPTSAPMVSNTTNGFRIIVTAADCGGEMLDSDAGLLKAPPGKVANTTDAKQCFWLVGLSPSTKGSQQKIVQFNSTTNSSSLKGFLEVHEGNSLRDSLATNQTGLNLLSRTDHLLFIYSNSNSTAGPSFSASYVAHACSAQCDNGICMHDDWKCNGKNDCGDWSDEKYCSSPSPSPPSPTPEPSKPISGASTTALALGILAALLIGALLGFAAPAAYRRIRSGRLGGSYSSFSNAADA